jgi:hypothetical protein
MPRKKNKETQESQNQQKPYQNKQSAKKRIGYWITVALAIITIATLLLSSLTALFL